MARDQQDPNKDPNRANNPDAPPVPPPGAPNQMTQLQQQQEGRIGEVELNGVKFKRADDGTIQVNGSGQFTRDEWASVLSRV